MPANRYMTGRWDEAVEIADEIISEFEGEPHYAEVWVRRARALLRLARDDGAGALEDAHRTLDVARKAKDPQAILTALSASVRVAAELGLGEEVDHFASELGQELGGLPPRHRIWYVDACWAAADSGLTRQLHSALELQPERPWAVAALAIVDKRYGDAAMLLSEFGATADEAYARLRAAEQHAAAGRRAEANAELDLALAFYRSVGATRYIRQGEALLAATA